MGAFRGSATLRAVAVALPFALTPIGAPSANARATSITAPHAGTRTSPCPNGDEVLYEGTQHTVEYDDADRSGGEHTVMISVLQAEGVGLPSALEYRITEIRVQEVQRSDGATEVTDRDLFLAVAPGQDNDFSYSSIDHMTISASGQVDRSPPRAEARCR